MTFPQLILTFFADYILGFLILVVFIGVILSWLIAFNVVNPHNQFVRTLWQISEQITRPLLNPIRQVLPTMGGLDLSPIVLFLIISFVQNYIVGQVLFRAFG